MKSRANAAAISELQRLSDNAKSELKHVINNGHTIISGIAQQLLESDDESVRARARTIIRTVDELTAQQRELFRPPVDAHIGGTGGE